MKTKLRPQSVRARRGVVYVLAMILLTVFATLAVVFASSTDMNLRKSDNHQRAQAALLEAENGLNFMLLTLKNTRLPGSTTQETFAVNATDALGLQLDGTANLAGQTVSASGETSIVPTVATPGGQFNSVLSLLDTTCARLVVTGLSRDVSRRVSMDLDLVTRRPAVFDYGLASKGQIIVHGNAHIVGVNYPGEASVLSATQNASDAILVDGSVSISGDLYAAGDDAYVAITGNPTIAGSKDPGIYGDHIHIGAAVPDFPEVETTSLAPLAVNVIDSSTTIPNGAVLNNVRIAAGTNPTFSNDVAFNGIVYIEAPNVVNFEAKVVVRGMVVTEDSDEPLEDCQLRFAGRVEAYGVETLPDTPEFADVRQQTGSFVVAPGFGVTFAGNFSAINGCIAADQLTFTGTAEGVVKGSVIGLEDVLTDVGGNVDIYVDRSSADQNPAGFVNSVGFAVVAGSYMEHLGG